MYLLHIHSILKLITKNCLSKVLKTVFACFKMEYVEL